MDKRILMIGIGNSGRGDDALGWMFIDEVAGSADFDTEYRYQLQVEDADLIRGYDSVIFVDASARELDQGFSFAQCEARNTPSFTTHRLDPESLLWLCQELYGSAPEARVMAIEGRYWELHQGLSAAAQQHLKRALAHFKSWMAAGLSREAV